MLVSSSHLTLVGRPFISGAEVDAMVEEVAKKAKVIISRDAEERITGRRTDTVGM
jgi:ribosomal protein L21